MSSIPEKTRSALKLSPEKYVEYRIQQLGVSQLPHSPTRTFELDEDAFQIEYFNYDWDLLTLLRTARLHEFEFSDSDDQKASYYCEPVCEVAQKFILNADFPPVRAIRGQEPSSEFGTVYFIASSKVEGPNDFHLDGGRPWHSFYPKGSAYVDDEESPAWDPNEQRKCFVVVMFMAPGTIDLEFNREDFLKDSTGHTGVRDAFKDLIRKIKKTEACYGVLTDEITSVIVQQAPNDSDDMSTPHSFSIVRTSKYSIGMVILNGIYIEAYLQKWTRPCPSISDVIQVHNSEVTKRASDSAPTNEGTAEQVEPITRGETIQLTPVDFISSPDGSERASNYLWPLRSSYPQPSYENLTAGYKQLRPKNQTLAESLKLSGSIVVNEELETGEGYFQTVLCGCVDNPHEQFVVKIFDQRFFPPLEGMYVWERLSLSSEDLLRREESIYHRLADFQGSLLPHCYGFFLFTMPDGWQSYGLITENISSKTLDEFYLSTPRPAQWLEDTVIYQIRMGVRVLRAHGISQLAWQTDKIHVVEREDETEQVVFMDFESTIMLYDQFWDKMPKAVPVTNDLMRVSGILRQLGASEKLLDKHWSIEHELEFED